MIKVKHIHTGKEFEVPTEHWEQVLSNSPVYERVVEAPKPKRGRPRKEKQS